MKTYLVTGGAGFIGSNFIKYLYETYGEEITVINLDLLTYAGNLKNLKEVKDKLNYHFIHGDICDTALVSNIMSEYEIDSIVHFAAESHVDRSIESSMDFARTNVLGTVNMLQCAKTAWEIGENYKEGKRFLFVSTDEVYGALKSEGYFTEDTPLAPRNPYSASKASADLMAKAFYDTYHFPVLRTRCSNNYGPHQYQEKLIPLFIKNCLEEKKLPIYGDGKAIRDWLHVIDHCRAIDMVLRKGVCGEVYNIGSNNEKSTNEIADLIIKILNQDYGYQISEDIKAYVTDRKGHDKRYAIDARKIKYELQWVEEIDFKRGIRDTIDWYINHQEFLKTE